ncbi:MAG: cobalamin biosynthesis protein, partial [Myxococcota bacterium]
EEELFAATIESLTENISDSVVAPLMYYLFFGIQGAIVYRAINTMDAMIGYRGQYLWFGKAAARVDDLVNWVPSRVTAFIMVVASLPLGLSLRDGIRIFFRDRYRTESPNAGQPMAMAAGLLGVRLEKREHYVLHAEAPSPKRNDLECAIRLTSHTCFLAQLLCLVFVLCLPLPLPWAFGGMYRCGWFE